MSPRPMIPRSNRGITPRSPTTQLTFAAGVTEQMVDVTINNDTIFEISEDFFLDLSNPGNATILDGQGVGTITDDGTGTGGTDDDTPTFTVSDVMVDEDTAGFAVFTITLDNASAEAITLDLALADDTGTGDGTDYGSAGLDNIQVAPDGVTFANGTSITFAAGDTEVSVRTPITVDAIDEADETFDLTATLNTGTTVNADDTGTGTITDDDNAPTLSVDDVSVNEGAGTLTLTVSLSSASSQTVTVDVATADDTATQPGDYTEITTTQLTFAAGVTEQMVDVTINNDTIFEISEDFFLDLSNPGNATILDGQGVGTITDDGTGTGGTDDDTPTFTVSDVMVDEDTAGFAVFTITLDNASAEAITLDLALADDTATGGGTDYGSAGLDNIQVAPDGVTFVNGTSVTFAAGDTEVSVQHADHGRWS